MPLIEKTLFGTIDRVQISIDKLRMFEPPEGYYVVFSGGKDSIVMLDVVKRSGVKYDAYYNLTTVDPPELVHFIRREYPDVKVNRPAMTMWQLIEKKMMPPTRIARYCCAYLKESNGTGTIVTGIRAAESIDRANRHSVEICKTDPSRRYVHPIFEWSNLDVWEYIRGNGMPYPKLYDEGWKRIGCVMCPMGMPVRMRRDAKRWPKIAAAYQRAFDRAARSRHEKGLVDKNVNWADGASMYRWWLEDASQLGDGPLFRMDQFDDENG